MSKKTYTVDVRRKKMKEMDWDKVYYRGSDVIAVETFVKKAIGMCIDTLLLTKSADCTDPRIHIDNAIDMLKTLRDTRWW
jgi:hypothetical protein